PTLFRSVELAQVHGSGGAHHAERLVPLAAIPRDRFGEGIEVHGTARPARYSTQRFRTDADELAGLHDGVVDALGGVGRELRHVLYAVSAALRAQGVGAGSGQCNDRCLGRARDEDAAAALRETEAAAAPVDHLALHVDGAVVAAAAVAVHRGSNDIRQQAAGEPGTMDPPEESRMYVSGGVGEHVRDQLVDEDIDRLAVLSRVERVMLP